MEGGWRKGKERGRGYAKYPVASAKVLSLPSYIELYTHCVSKEYI